MTEQTTFGEIAAKYDRIYELHRQIKNEYHHGTSFAKLHLLTQELADLTREFVPKH
jgi:hypothetical protein